MQFNRHDMLFLYNAPLLELSDMPFIPAIVKMQENSQENFNKDLLEVGFSLPQHQDGSRIRLKAVISTDNIQKVVTPYEVLPLYHRLDEIKHVQIRDTLKDIISTDIQGIGVYGSCALEILTSQPYLTSKSDIDICIKLPGNYDAFYTKAKEISKRHDVHIDIEAILPDGFGVKLEELMGSTNKTVLCKGLYGIELRYKEDLFM